MLGLDILPSKYRAIFSSIAGEKSPAYCCQADISSENHFEDVYVVANDQYVVCFENGKVLANLPISSVEEVRICEQFGASKLVAISHGRHVTLARFTRNHAAAFSTFRRVVEDYACGRTPIVPDSLPTLRCSSCSAPLPDPDSRCAYCQSHVTLLRRMVHLLRPYRTYVFLLILASSAAVGFSLIPPYTFKLIADQVIENGHHDRLGILSIAMFLAFLFEACFRFASTWISAWLGAKVASDIRSRLHAHTQRLKMSYYGSHDPGDVVSRIVYDSGELQHFIVDCLPYLLVNVLSSLCIALILVALNWKLAILVFIPVPVLIFGGKFYGGILRPMFHQFGNHHGALHTNLGESLRGVVSVKSLGQEDRRIREFDNANTKVMMMDTSVNRLVASFLRTMYVATALGTVLVWYFGCRWIVSDDPSMNLGTLLAYAGYLAVFYGPLQWFSGVFNALNSATISAERVFNMLDQPVEAYEAPNAVSVSKVRGQISFRDVRFSYHRGTEVIKGIDLDIPAGKMVGIVGRSGAGKSTIINLLCRFYEPDSGCIYVDGHDLQSLNLREWRKRIGIVMQRPILFNASIAENIRYGSPDASFEDVIVAARKAQAHEFVLAKEDGYDTIVGENGEVLSGGESQRIAIARAILDDPPVLILDEATSAVDSVTEEKIRLAIANLVQGRTTIAIAHRLATLKNADLLFVIDDGEIVEQGSHTELMIKDGQFAKLVAIQSELTKLHSEQRVC